MVNRKEELFQLQVFQEVVSTLYMYPLRIYKNDCYENFVYKIINSFDFEKIHQCLSPTSKVSRDEIITLLKKKIKHEPETLNENSELYKLLDKYAEELREAMWETHPSNSLTFVRQIKENRRIWIFLMIYDLFSKEFIENNFAKTYMTTCLLDMKSIYIQLNAQYTLSIGRIFHNNYHTKEIVKTIIHKYDFNNLNIFELINSSKKRKVNLRNLEHKIFNIEKAFKLFLENQTQLPSSIHKDELEKVALFICLVTQNSVEQNFLFETKTLSLKYQDKKLIIRLHKISKNDLDELNELEEFEDVLEVFERNRDYFRNEYILRLKSNLLKNYTGLKNYDSFSPVKDLLKHITSRLNADGASFIKYNLGDGKLTLEAINGVDDYEKGIERIVGQINREEPHTLKKSRVLKIVENYYKSSTHYDLESLVLKNLNSNRILQPVKSKEILSNIAIPLTLEYKLLGVLLIDSFRKDNFTKDDINLIFSISNLLSVQIFDHIVESNLSHIMENLPQKAKLDDASIDRYYHNLAVGINNIFFSHGVSIWEYSHKTSSFILKSTTLVDESINTRKISDDSNELISKLIDGYSEQNFEYLSEYNIKESDFLKSVDIMKYHPKINCLRIYPIIRDRVLIGAFSVYNHSKSDYKAIDIPSLVSVRKHLTIFFNTIEVMNAQRALTKTEALHEIHARFNMVENKTKQLKSLVNDDFKELDHYARYRFSIKLDDINDLIANTRVSFNYIANKSKTLRNLNHVDDEILHLYQPLLKEKQVNNVRYLINELANSIPYPYNQKNIRVNNMVNEQINLNVHSLILNDVFQNIFLNAVKYSFQGTTIRVYTKEKSNSIRIYIKNDGLSIRKDEEIDIFKYGYRGFSIKGYEENINGERVSYVRKESENLGIGLYKSNEIVKKILSGEIRLNREKSIIPNAEINTFEIIFPKAILNKERMINE